MDLITLALAKKYTNDQIDGVNTDIGAIESALDGKSNKPESPTEGNIAVLDADGNVADGNSSLSDIASQIDEIVRFSSGTGSPAGVYADISALIFANPDHTKIYVTLNDGKWCYWNGDTFVSAAVYQTLASTASDIPTSTAGVSVQDALDEHTSQLAEIASVCGVTGDKVDELKSAINNIHIQESRYNEMLNPAVYGSKETVSGAAWAYITVLDGMCLKSGGTYKVNITIDTNQEANWYINVYKKNGTKYVGPGAASGLTATLNLTPNEDMDNMYVQIGLPKANVGVYAEYTGTGGTTIDGLDTRLTTVENAIDGMTVEENSIWG